MVCGVGVCGILGARADDRAMTGAIE